MQGRDVTITLQLRVDGDEVAGVASGAGREPRPFAGWIALITAIDALVAEQPVTTES